MDCSCWSGPSQQVFLHLPLKYCIFAPFQLQRGERPTNPITTSPPLSISISLRDSCASRLTDLFIPWLPIVYSPHSSKGDPFKAATALLKTVLWLPISLWVKSNIYHDLQLPTSSSVVLLESPRSPHYSLVMPSTVFCTADIWLFPLLGHPFPGKSWLTSFPHSSPQVSAQPLAERTILTSIFTGSTVTITILVFLIVYTGPSNLSSLYLLEWQSYNLTLSPAQFFPQCLYNIVKPP